MPKLFDLIVIGAGPAGLTAAMYVARANLKVLVLRDKEGGNLKRVPAIYNYFGFPSGISGSELLRLGERHAKKYGAVIKQEEVLRTLDCRLLPKGSKSQFRKKCAAAKYLVHTQKSIYETKTLLIAIGMQIRSAGIEGEFKYLGKGVSVCVSCDGPLFKNKKVMVLGAGDFAANEALGLLAHTKNIVVNQNGQRNHMTPLWKRQLKQKKIQVINKKIAKVGGRGRVEEIEFMDETKEKIDGLFLASGSASAIDFARSMGLHMKIQALAVDESGRTNLGGVWAAGDVIGPPRQVGKAVGDGIKAATNIIETLIGGTYIDHHED